MPLHDVLHRVPLCQIFALNACHAWSKGLEPSEGSYETRQFALELARIKAAAKPEPLTPEE